MATVAEQGALRERNLQQQLEASQDALQQLIQGQIITAEQFAQEKALLEAIAIQKDELLRQTTNTLNELDEVRTHVQAGAEARA